MWKVKQITKLLQNGLLMYILVIIQSCTAQCWLVINETVVYHHLQTRAWL